MLIPIEYGYLLNTDAIRSIKELPATGDGRDRIEITFTDGTRKIVNRPVEELEWCTGPIIPAPAGYSIIRAYRPEKEGEPTTFSIFPVVAFRLTDAEPVPVSPYGRLGESWALVWPDGRCDEHWNRLYENVEAFKASFGPNGVRA